MGWASRYIDQLKLGQPVSFRPRGNSMAGIIENGQLVTIVPLGAKDQLRKGDVVLCKVQGREYLHLIKGERGSQFQIGNNKGGINGWTTRRNIFGRFSEPSDTESAI